MAVTPLQAEQLLPAEKEQAWRLEAMIDAFLPFARKDAEGGRLYELQCNVANKVVCNVIGNYQTAGWNVERRNGIGFCAKEALYFVPKQVEEPEMPVEDELVPYVPNFPMKGAFN